MSMKYDDILRRYESAYNCSPCKNCGKQHVLHLDQVPSNHKSLCNQADAIIPRGDITITIQFDDEACMAAQMEVVLSVSSLTASY